MANNRFWLNRIGKFAPTSNPYSNVPNYGLTFDVATAPWDDETQFDALVAEQVASQLINGLTTRLVNTFRPKVEFTPTREGDEANLADKAWSGLKSAVETAGDAAGWVGTGAVGAVDWFADKVGADATLDGNYDKLEKEADRRGLTGWERLQFIGKSDLTKAGGQLAKDPLASKAFWALDKVSEGVATTFVTGTLSDNNPLKMLDGDTWAQAHGVVKQYDLNAGEGFVQMFWDKELLNDEDRLREMRQNSGLFNFGALTFNVIGAWKFDPAVLAAKGAGKVRDFRRGQIAPTGEARAIQTNILAQPTREAAEEVARSQTGLANRVHAAYGLTLWDKAQKLRDTARSVSDPSVKFGFEDFTRLAPFSQAAGGPVLAKLLVDASTDDKKWDLTFRAAIGDPMARQELLDLGPEVADKLNAMELGEMPRLQAEFDAINAKYEARLLEQGGKPDLGDQLILTSPRDWFLDLERTEAAERLWTAKAELGEYKDYESWWTRATQGMTDEKLGGGDKSRDINVIFGQLDTLNPKKGTREAVADRNTQALYAARSHVTRTFRKDEYSRVSRLVSAPRKPFLKLAGVASLHNVQEGTVAVTSQLDAISYFKGANDPVLRDHVLQRFTGATSEVERKAVAEELERQGYYAVFQKNGITSPALQKKMADRLLEKRALGWQRLSDESMYTTVRDEKNRRLDKRFFDYEDDQGTPTSIAMPLDPSELPNWFPFTNLMELDKQVALNKDILLELDKEASLVKRGIIKGGHKAARALERLYVDGGEGFNTLWKPVALLSLRWPARVVLDEGFRTLHVIGAAAMFASWGEGVANVAYNGLVRPKEFVNGRILRRNTLAEDALRAPSGTFDPHDYRAALNPQAAVPAGALDFENFDDVRHTELVRAAAERRAWVRKGQMGAKPKWAQKFEDRIAAIEAGLKGGYAGMSREDFLATGEDLMHGTIAQFDTFGAGLDRNKVKQDGSAFYFTDDANVAKRFGEDRAYGYLSREDAGIRNAEFADDDDFRSFLRDKKVDDNLQRYDEATDTWLDVSVDEVTLADLDGEMLRRRVHKNARTVKAKVYGKTLDLGHPLILGKSGQRWHKEYLAWYKGLPDEVKEFIQTSDSPSAKALRAGLNGVQGQYGFNWRQHTGDKALLEFARKRGYGKIRVPDSANVSGEYSYLVPSEFIAHNRNVVDEFFPKNINPSRGFFFDPVTGRAKNKGYAVSVYPGRMRSFERRPSAAELHWFLEKNEDILSSKNNQVATWLDKDTGRWHLDVVRVSRRREDAMTLAARADATEFFDIGDGFTRYMRDEDPFEHAQYAAKGPDEAPEGEAPEPAPGAVVDRPAKRKIGFGTKRWRSLDGKVVEGEGVYGMSPDDANVYFDMHSAKGFAHRLFSGNTKGLANLRRDRGSGHAVVYHPNIDVPDSITNKRWSEAQSEYVNRHLRKSPLAMRMLAGASDTEVIDWLTKTAQGRQLRNRFPLRGQNPRKWVDDVRYIVEAHLPTREAKAAAAARDIEADEWDDLVPLDIRHEVHGDDVLMALGTHKVQSFARRTADNVMSFLAGAPTTTLVRHPFANALYQTHMRNYLASVPSGMIDQGLIDTAAASARAFATKQVKRTLYNIADENQFGHMLRFVAPFIQAQLEVIERYAHLWTTKPESLVRTMQLYYLSQNPHEDRGVWHTENADGDPTGTLSHDNKVVFHDNALTRAFKRWMPGLDEASPLEIPVSSIDLIFQGDKPYLPSMGPLVTVPANEFYFQSRPEMSTSKVFEWLYPFGTPKGSNPVARAFQGMAPAWAKRVVTAYLEQDTDSAFITFSQSRFAGKVYEYQQAHGGKYPPKAVESRFVQESIKETHHYWLVRAASSFVSPFPIEAQSPYQFYIDDAHKMRNKFGVGWEEKFYDKHGAEFFIFATSTSKSTNGLTPTIEGVKGYKKYKKYIDVAPDLAGVLAGPMPPDGGEYTYEVYNWQTRTPKEPGSKTKMREFPDLTTKVAETQISQGWVEYGKLAAVVDAELRARGLKSLNASAAGDLARWKAEGVQLIMERNPAWQEAYGSRQDQLSGWLRQANAVVFEPAFDGRPDIEGLRDYLLSRERMQEILWERYRAGGSKSLGTFDETTGTYSGENPDLSAAWDAYTRELKSKNPLFAEIYNRFLEADDLSVTVVE